MNVASLERCKELHELSGWEDTEKSWHEVDYSDHVDVELGRNDLPNTDLHFVTETPAYDLGYLLRKLTSQFPVIEYVATELWGCYPFGEYERRQKADTPEDALCKLSIELFKQGLLTKEES